LGNIEFGVKFNGNSLTISTKGFTDIYVEEFDEMYEFDKPLPDMFVLNVVWGTRRTAWDGKARIFCKKSKLSCEIDFTEKTPNSVFGSIKKEDQEIFKVEGFIGEKINAINSEGKSILLADLQSLKKANFKYAKPEEMNDKDSLKIWKKVNDAIIANDIPLADIEKKKIEDAQRKKEEQMEQILCQSILNLIQLLRNGNLIQKQILRLLHQQLIQL